MQLHPTLSFPRRQWNKTRLWDATTTDFKVRELMEQHNYAILPVNMARFCGPGEDCAGNVMYYDTTQNPGC